MHETFHVSGCASLADRRDRASEDEVNEYNTSQELAYLEGVSAPPGFGGGLLPSRRKSEVEPAACRGGGHLARVIFLKLIIDKRIETPGNQLAIGQYQKNQGK